MHLKPEPKPLYVHVVGKRSKRALEVAMGVSFVAQKYKIPVETTFSELGAEIGGYPSKDLKGAHVILPTVRSVHKKLEEKLVDGHQDKLIEPFEESHWRSIRVIPPADMPAYLEIRLDFHHKLKRLRAEKGLD